MKNSVTRKDLDNGQIVNIGDPFADEVGFTADKFDGYLWKIGQVVYISFIVSKQPRHGYLSLLFDALWSKGYTIKVPTPLPTMETILLREGFQEKKEEWEEMGESVVVWEKEPRCFSADRTQVTTYQFRERRKQMKVALFKFLLVFILMSTTFAGCVISSRRTCEEKGETKTCVEDYFRLGG